ncbi:MAG: zinc-binding dehydrogenase [Gammaproteobacteria bacterium]|nr:zinc-binding dehydrogenase [Gammaproteobacteria bacterium]
MQGWAEYVALPSRDVAAIPDAISDDDAATLPVAALTALYALERCERLLGSGVLVTGASGGVGYFACQLARLMGANVTALLRRTDHQSAVEATGAKVVISSDGLGLTDVGPFRAIIDGVGGDTLGALLTRLEPSGRAIVYGVSGGADATIPVRDLMFTGDGRIDGFHLYRESEFESASRGLTRLLALLESGRLTTLVGVTGDWSKVGATAAQLIGRNYPGKAVLRIS